jgi:hypothetical protein
MHVFFEGDFLARLIVQLSVAPTPDAQEVLELLNVHAALI